MSGHAPNELHQQRGRRSCPHVGHGEPQRATADAEGEPRTENYGTAGYGTASERKRANLRKASYGRRPLWPAKMVLTGTWYRYECRTSLEVA